jgi:hypothetical protein
MAAADNRCNDGGPAAILLFQANGLVHIATKSGKTFLRILQSSTVRIVQS